MGRKGDGETATFSRRGPEEVGQGTLLPTCTLAIGFRERSPGWRKMFAYICGDIIELSQKLSQKQGEEAGPHRSSDYKLLEIEQI